LTKVLGGHPFKITKRRHGGGEKKKKGKQCREEEEQKKGLNSDTADPTLPGGEQILLTERLDAQAVATGSLALAWPNLPKRGKSRADHELEKKQLQLGGVTPPHQTEICLAGTVTEKRPAREDAAWGRRFVGAKQ
jgi:hypothetical protein